MDEVYHGATRNSSGKVFFVFVDQLLELMHQPVVVGIVAGSSGGGAAVDGCGEAVLRKAMVEAEGERHSISYHGCDFSFFPLRSQPYPLREQG
ncbi:hypothetical protein U1Q18_038625 [Sarracenia purpurea var. burkii]